MKRQSPYELICNPDKTTLTCPGGVVLGYGPGPGLRHSIFWNRIGSLFSCFRPAVAVLDVFDASKPHAPVALKTANTRWEPNLCTASYTTTGLKIEEQRTSLKAGLSLKLKFSSTAKQPREWVLFFHGAVEQWPFFDYKRDLPTPSITCETEPARGRITLIQPHPHDGLPREVNSIQSLEASEPFAACGFLQNVSELNTLWQEHGCLASIRMRLGQVGGRYQVMGRGRAPHRPVVDDRVARASSPRSEKGQGGQDARPTDQKDGGQDARRTDQKEGGRVGPPHQEKLTFTHTHPVYYFAQRVTLEPGESRVLHLTVEWHTDDEGGILEDALSGTTREEWEHYLSEEVPQLECDDPELERYWYYVWYVLRANRTAPGRHIKHAFTAPSKYMYWGPWIWDGYFHVLGEMWLKDPEIARDSIRAVLDMQFPNGFIPVCSGSQYRMCFHEHVPGYEHPGGGGYASYVESEIRKYKECKHPFEAEFEYQVGDKWQHMLHNEKTQTPLITQAVYELSYFARDREIFVDVYEQLKHYDDWLWQRRTDKQGRFILWHGDESGWDNATRHYSVPAKPFDVQVHVLMHREVLYNLCSQLIKRGSPDKDLTERLRKTESALITYWHGRDRWFYDFGAKGVGQGASKTRKQIAPSGLFGLLLPFSLPDDLQSEFAKWVAELLENPQVFGTEFPLPTLATCDPDYDPHSWGWNGPVWLQVNYFSIIGLLRNKEFGAAFKLWEKTKRLIIRDGKPHSYELYDPELGTGMGCPDYSWQAMILNLIIRDFAGVHPFMLSPALPPGMNHLKISNLAGSVRAIEITREAGVVNLAVECATPRPLCIMPGGLGKVRSVSANGTELEEMANHPGAWSVPDSGPIALEWEIQVHLVDSDTEEKACLS